MVNKCIGLNKHILYTIETFYQNNSFTTIQSSVKYELIFLQCTYVPYIWIMKKIYCNGSGTRSLICKLRQIGYYIQDENRTILINFTSIASTSGLFLNFCIALWNILETLFFKFPLFYLPNSKALLKH